MKKTRLWLSVMVAMLLSCLLMAFTACGGNEEKDEVEIQLNHQTYSLDLHEEIQLVATTKNTEAAVTFQSSAPDVAMVDGNGLVKSVKVGKSTITAKVEDKTAVCEITVTNSGTAPVLEVSLNTLGINKDAEFTVDAAVKYKGAAVTETVTYTWAVSQGAQDGLISLTPSADGKSAVVKGLEYGETSFDVSTVIWGVPLKQTVSVKVCNTDISFEVSDLEPCEGGYSATIALVATEDYETTSTPAVTVKNKGTAVSDAQITWTSDKEGIVSVEGGVISAVTAGEVVLTGSYDNNYFKLYVTVIRPEITLSEVTVETIKATLTLAEGDKIAGTISKVTIGDETNLYDRTDAGVIKLKSDLLPKEASKLGEGKTITVETEKAVYSVPANLYTQVIHTKAELADWGTLAKAANSNSKIWDGYFVLGNDIDFEGNEYQSFIRWANTETLDCTTAGFKGVFDGKGHIIDDIVIDPNANGGFIGMMFTSSGGSESGVLRNVAFTNAVSKGNGGFVVSSGGGKVSNVYVSLNELKGGRNPDRSGVFFTRDAVGWAARVTDCFVEIKSVEKDAYTFAIGAKHRRTGMIQNVYAVGYDNAFFELSDATWDNPADVYGAYTDYASFLAEGIDFSAWDTDFWKVVDGIPYPKNLDESKIPQIEKADLQATVSTVKMGSSAQVTAKKVTLQGLYGSYDATTAQDGSISISNVIKGSYIARLEGEEEYLDARITFDGTATAIAFEYARFEGSGGYDLTNQNKADSSVIIGEQQHNYVLTKDKYDDVSVTATFKSSYGSYKGFMGIQLVFDDGNGVMLVFECMNSDGNIHADQMKLCFGTDCWGAKYAITGNALTGWISVSEPLNSDMAAAFGGAGVEVTVVRKGNSISVLYGGKILKTIEIADYATEKCRVSFFTEWGNAEIPFAIDGILPDADVTLTGADNLTNGTVTLDKNGYKLCDEVVLNVNPANGYKLKNITVDGKNMTANVADGKLTLGYATVEKTYAITATFIEEKDSYDVTFSYDTTKYTADGLVITLTKGSDTKTVTLGNGAVVNGLAVGEWAATAQFGGMTVSLGNFDIQVDEFFVDLGRVFDGSGAITGADFTNNTFDYKMFVKSHEDFQPAFMTEATGIAEGNAFFMTKISLDAASQGVITSSKAWCVVRLFMQVADSRQEIMLAYNHFENAFRLIQLPDWTMVDLSTDLKTAYESGNGIYVVWGYNAESGGMDIYAGTTKENVAKVGSFRADAFPKNGTVSAVGFGDGLWGNPDFSVTVELNYGATLNEALGLTESE